MADLALEISVSQVSSYISANRERYHCKPWDTVILDMMADATRAVGLVIGEGWNILMTDDMRTMSKQILITGLEEPDRLQIETKLKEIIKMKRFRIFGTPGCGKCGQLKLRMIKKYGEDQVEYIDDPTRTVSFIRANDLDEDVPKMIETGRADVIYTFDSAVKTFL